MADIYKSEAGKHAVEEFYRNVLQRWPVASRHIVVPTRHGDTFVIASGPENSPAVVLLHGSGTNSSIWIRDVRQWAEQFRVYAVDIIGEPGLSAPSRPPLGSGAYAEWLDDVWNGLGVERATIVGVSLGGWLGLEYAVKRPDRVASLSLLSPSGIGSQKTSFLLKAAVLLMLGRVGLRKSLQLTAGGAALPQGVSSYITLIFQHFRPRMEKVPILSDAELAGLAMQVQIFLGGNDALIRSQETRDRMRRLVPHAEVTYLEHEGHLLPPQTSAIAEFLAAGAGPDRRGAGARTGT